MKMFGSENDRLRIENEKLKDEKALLQKQLDNLELEFYRRLFKQININIRGGELNGQENV